MQILSALIPVCILAGAIAAVYGVVYIAINWGVLAIVPPWRPTIAACVSAGAFTTAWALHLLRERCRSAE